MSDTNKHFVVFSLDGRYFALPLEIVERIARAVAITPLSHASDIVIGVINLQGRVIPVMNIRKRFSLPDKEVSADNHFIIGKTRELSVALLVDTVYDIIEVPEEEFVKNKDIVSDMLYVTGVVKQSENMILVHDLDALLSDEAYKKVESALKTFMNKTTSKPKSKPKPKDKPSQRKK